MDKDDYETLLFENDFQKDIIENCLSIVKKFILDRQRILVGGMAIDFALRLKGNKLYNDNKLPDYDFWSPEFHKDAYDLSDILSKKYDKVSAINAQHISTMRVRVNFVVVADITYCPLNLYNATKTLSYNGIRFIHPHYQMIDQHRALSLPYENPPRETIIGKRWKNDIERFDMLYKYYKIVDNEFNYDEKLYEIKKNKLMEEKKEATDLFHKFGNSDFLIEKKSDEENKGYESDLDDDTNNKNGDENSDENSENSDENSDENSSENSENSDENSENSDETSDEIGKSKYLDNNKTNNKQNNKSKANKPDTNKDKIFEIDLKEKEKDISIIKDKLNDLIDLNDLSVYNFSYEELDGVCLGGYISLMFWLQKGKELGYMGYVNLGEIQLNKNDVLIKLPKTENIMIISDNYIDTIYKLKLDKTSNKYYNGLLDKIPRIIEYNNINIKNCDGNSNIRIIDNKGRMLGSYQPLLTKRLYISNLQDTLVYFLTYGCFMNNILYIKLYIIGLSLLFWACDKYTGLFLTSSEEINQTVKDKYFIFLPTPYIYGNFNWSESYIISREKLIDEINNNTKYNLKNKKPAEMHLELGQNTQKIKYEFEPAKSPLYQFDGLECLKFEPKDLPEI
jgi:hypothetical protein